MLKPKEFYSTIIDKAFENGDKATVVDAFVETLDYDQLTREHIIKVYESLDHETAIDHATIGQL